MCDELQQMHNFYALFIYDNLEGDTTTNPRLFNGNLGGGTVTNVILGYYM
jgi:hypothetical protein